MQSMNDVHAKIMAHYRKLQNDNEMNEKAARDMMYMRLPRVEEIDTEISTLAINHAKRVLEEKISPEEAARQIKLEAAALREEKNKLLISEGITEYSPAFECDKCKDTGYLTDGKKCGCYMRKMQEALLLPGEKGENAICKKSSFDKFNLSYYPDDVVPAIGVSARELMRVVYANCFKFATEFDPETSGNLLLCGPSGLGKTFLAASIANEVTDRGYFVIYKTSYKLFQFLEDFKFGKIDREAYSVIYDSIYDCDLLVIDDFGTEFITSYTQSVFFDLLSTRLNCDKSTIISTNLTLAKIKEIYQDRVSSRLQNEFSVLRFAGEDIRVVKNRK